MASGSRLGNYVTFVSASQNINAETPWVRIYRLTSLADIAVPFRLFQHNLRGKGALAGLIAQHLGQPKFVMLKCLTRLIDLQLKLLERLIGQQLFTRTPVLSGLDFTVHGEAFPCRSEDGADFGEHWHPFDESRHSTTPKGPAQ